MLLRDPYVSSEVIDITAAYLSPDTLLIRESGLVSFKAIPEEKPLEVIFMAPELQSKGELSEKVGDGYIFY